MCGYISFKVCDLDQDILSRDKHLSLWWFKVKLRLVDDWEWDGCPCAPNSFMQDLRFSWWRRFKSQSSGLWLHVVMW